MEFLPQAVAANSRPDRVDRLVVEQFDPAHPSPGGINTCIRGLCKYGAEAESIAIVGVDTGRGPQDRKLGKWELYSIGEGKVWFLPVARLDPADQNRVVPHSLRLVAGYARFKAKLPKTSLLQVHRMDTAFALSRRSQRVTYFIHNQQSGAISETSDSFWRYAGRLRQALENFAISRASGVVVFNKVYADHVKKINEHTVFSPTWFDPAIYGMNPAVQRDFHKLIWIGRFEKPKDPMLALAAFDTICSRDPEKLWSIDFIGDGTLLEEVKRSALQREKKILSQISFHGRQNPHQVAEHLRRSGVCIMTSYSGYEGYPRVLVEAMASGLPCVVTEGSDTGGLVKAGRTGFTCDRDPVELADAVRAATSLPRDPIREAVQGHDARTVVSSILHVTRKWKRSNTATI